MAQGPSLKEAVQRVCASEATRDHVSHDRSTGTSDVTGTKTFLRPRKLRALRVPRRHDQPPALLSSPLLSSL